MPIQTPSGINVRLINDQGYWIPIQNVVPWSPVQYTSATVQDIMTTPLRTMLYMQYDSDPHLVGFRKVANDISQEYLDWFNNVNLPIYVANSMFVGSTLDYVMTGIYGMPRPTIPSAMTESEGEYNTEQFDTEEYNYFMPSAVETSYVTTDDLYRRIATWIMYKGDGYVVTPQWIKRRIKRFLTGAEGRDATNTIDIREGKGNHTGVDETFDISVTYPGSRVISISVDTDGTGYEYMWNILKAAIRGGVCPMPLNYSYNLD